MVTTTDLRQAALALVDRDIPPPGITVVHVPDLAPEILRRAVVAALDTASARLPTGPVDPDPTIAYVAGAARVATTVCRAVATALGLRIETTNGDPAAPGTIPSSTETSPPVLDVQEAVPVAPEAVRPATARITLPLGQTAARCARLFDDLPAQARLLEAFGDVDITLVFAPPPPEGSPNGRAPSSDPGT